MKLFYASSLTYPSRYANRIQTLSTAQALAHELRSDFVLGANRVESNDMYTGVVMNFNYRRSLLLGWRQMHYIARHQIDTVYSREHQLLFAVMVYNAFFFHRSLKFYYEAHFVPAQGDFRFRYVLRRCTHAFAITARLADAVRPFAPHTPFDILPDGVDVEKFAHLPERAIARRELGLPATRPIAAYIGSVSVHSWKGVDIFLASHAHLAHTDAVLYCVLGAGENERGALQEKYPEGEVQILAWMPQEGVRKLLAAADILVLPNKAGIPESELYTSPMKMFEYMASSKPILASDLPSLREVLTEQSALLVVPNDPVALARGIERLLAEPVYAARLAARAREDVAAFSWKRRAQAILSALL
jgi:glycosyltransferase involved in cell wall biosynthesis